MPETHPPGLSETRDAVGLLDPVIARGQSKKEDFLALDELAGRIAARHQELRITR